MYVSTHIWSHLGGTLCVQKAHSKIFKDGLSRLVKINTKRLGPRNLPTSQHRAMVPYVTSHPIFILKQTGLSDSSSLITRISSNYLHNATYFRLVFQSLLLLFLLLTLLIIILLRRDFSCKNLVFYHYPSPLSSSSSQSSQYLLS